MAAVEPAQVEVFNDLSDQQLCSSSALAHDRVCPNALVHEICDNQSIHAILELPTLVLNHIARRVLQPVEAVHAEEHVVKNNASDTVATHNSSMITIAAAAEYTLVPPGSKGYV